MGKTKHPNQSKKSKFSKKIWSGESVANALHKIRSGKSIWNGRIYFEKKDKIDSIRD